ncbi:MAG: hypothetical protein QNJ37_10935 [Crocosphaera sp.]|nr:hypothetical protein [Crocosphaera sp.]
MAQEKPETPDYKRLQGFTEKAREATDGINNAIEGVGNPLLKFAESAKNSSRRVLGAVAIGAGCFIIAFSASSGDNIENKLPVAGGAGIGGTAAALAVLPRSKREQKSLEFAEKRYGYKQFLKDNQQEIKRIKDEIEWAKENAPQLVDSLLEEYKNLLEEQKQIRHSFNSQVYEQPFLPPTSTPQQRVMTPSSAQPFVQDIRSQPQTEPIEPTTQPPDDEKLTNP